MHIERSVAETGEARRPSLHGCDEALLAGDDCGNEEGKEGREILRTANGQRADGLFFQRLRDVGGVIEANSGAGGVWLNNAYSGSLPCA